MSRQSLQERLLVRLQRAGQWLRSLLTNKYFWQGAASLLVIIGALYLLVNELIMPSYTRHGVAISVPRVVNQPFEEARQTLQQQNLQVERQRARQFNPNVPRGQVLDQQPPADALVKPGRRIYLTVNAGQTPIVAVPDLAGISLREAKNQLLTLGLKAGSVQVDPIPAPYPNTITKQSPAPGDSVKEGASVDLWYSQGLGEALAAVPDVRGLRVSAARDSLLARRLRAVVVDASDSLNLREERVRRQSRAPGDSARVGSEIRLYVQPESAAVDTFQVMR